MHKGMDGGRGQDREGLGMVGMPEVWRKQQEMRLVKQSLLGVSKPDLTSKHLWESRPPPPGSLLRSPQPFSACP